MQAAKTTKQEKTTPMTSLAAKSRGNLLGLADVWWAKHQYEYPEIRAGYKTKDGAKWRMASGLQKLIRRGYKEEAAHIAAAFYDLDKQYMLYRLATIACEDVGIGNLPILGHFAAVADTPEFRKDRERQLYSALAYEMAAGAKDRTGTEFLVLVKHEDILAQFDQYNQAASFCKEALNALSEVGRSGMNEFLWESGTPMSLIVIADLLLRRQRSLFPIGMAAALRMAGNLEDTYVEPDTYPWECRKIGKMYPAATYDKHTREGNRAIYTFCNKTGINKNRTGMVVFTSEGALVDKRLMYPGMRKIVLESKRVLDGEKEAKEVEHIQNTLVLESELLHELRVWSSGK